MRVFVESHGCRLNQAEGDAMASALRDAGHELVHEASEAQVVLLNGCTVTHSADADARKRVRAIHRERADTKVVVTGCFANMHAELAAKLPGVALVLGNVEKAGVVQALQSLDGVPGTDTESPSAPTAMQVEGLVQLRRGKRPRIVRPSEIMPAASGGQRTRAYLKVQDGCNYQCSFCIVPQVRGRSRSIAASQATQQLRVLLREGRPEVALTGVHLGTWGWDLGERDAGLSGLVQALMQELNAPVHGERANAQLRLGSLDPHELSSSLIEQLRVHAPRLCRHLHLPVQSGDDGVLARMRRAHRSADLGERVHQAVAAVPGLCVGSDFIVGFPGEDDQAFARSLAQLDELPIHYAHVFTYSPRAGTAAASFGDAVDPATMKSRSKIMRERVARNWRAFRSDQLGSIAPAMIFKRRDKKTGKLVGLTDNYIRVELEGADSLRGQRIEVELTELRGERCGAVVPQHA